MARRKIKSKITPQNLKVRCWKKDLTVAALARRIQRSRQMVYFAVENPSRFSPTYQLIEEALA
jgi:hypothetical protein